jgi:hypothetical protein
MDQESELKLVIQKQDLIQNELGELKARISSLEMQLKSHNRQALSANTTAQSVISPKIQKQLLICKPEKSLKLMNLTKT